MSPASAIRLSAPERRRALVDAALQVFSTRSYAGATTAEIARAAGVSEPILYRHFPSKRDLYLACLEHAWERLRATTERAVAESEGPHEWPTAIARAVRVLRARKCLPMQLWVQALNEAGDDPEIRRYMRRHVREVHAFHRDLIERAQAAGGVDPERDAEAEAWIGVGIGLLRAVEDSVGGVLAPEQFEAVAGSRRAWLGGATR